MLANLVPQAVSFWQRQKQSQKVIIVTMGLVLAILIPVLINWATSPSYAVAFSGLSESDAGKIVEQLQADNTSYQVRAGGTILVSSDKVYDTRLKMASAGLLQGGSAGFELFSGNTLGMTEFTQRVNYQRALEGELERTIGSLDAVKAVRVHVVTPEKTLLSSDQPPTTASITIQEKASRKLDAAQVRSITSLVANSVEGLAPENVVVVDTSGNLLAAGAGESGSGGALSQVDSRRSAELQVAADIQKKVKSLLDTALGPNRSVVQANVSLDWSDKEVTKQSFDATPSAILSNQKSSESYTVSGDTTGGIPGATTNLPTPVPGAAAGTTGSPTLYQRVDETINYEVASTESHEKIYPGQVRVVSLSVLVDGVKDADQLKTLQTAISAAAGIDSQRGDQISVQSLTFDKTFAEQQTADLTSADRTQTYTLIAEIVGAALVLGFLLWYVNRLLRNLRMASVEVWEPVLKPISDFRLPTSTSAASLNLSHEAQRSLSGGGLGGAFQAPAARYEARATTDEEKKMQQLITRMAEDNPASVAEIIQMWLNQDKSKNG